VCFNSFFSKIHVYDFAGREMGDLYLDARTETDDDDCCYVSVHSAVTLFVFKFCQVDQHLTLRFVTVRMHFCSCVLSVSMQLKIRQ